MNESKCPFCGMPPYPVTEFCPHCGARMPKTADPGRTVARVLLLCLSVFVALPLAIAGGGCLVFGVAGLNSEGFMIAGIGLAAFLFAVAILYATVASFRR